MKKITVLALAMAALLASGDATAGTMQTSFKVTATVVGKCQEVSTTDMDFGQVTAGTTSTATGSVSVLCNDGVEFLVKLGYGQNPQVFTQRHMSGPRPASNNLLHYDIFKDPSGKNPWGSSCVPFHLGCVFEPGPQGQLGTGTGAPVTMTTYGFIPAGGFLGIPQNVQAGRYEDVVNVEVFF